MCAQPQAGTNANDLVKYDMQEPNIATERG